MVALLKQKSKVIAKRKERKSFEPLDIAARKRMKDAGPFEGVKASEGG